MDDRTPHSSDLLKIPGRKQTLAKLLASDEQKKNDVLETTTEEAAPELTKEKPKMFKMGVNNDILAKVQSFLPQMQSANEQLTKQDTSKLDIENVEDDQEQYIEMNLGLGVFEQKKNKGGGSSSDSEQEDNDDAMNGSDDDDDDEDDIVIPSNTAQPKEKPNIQMLSESPKEK